MPEPATRTREPSPSPRPRPAPAPTELDQRATDASSKQRRPARHRADAGAPRPKLEGDDFESFMAQVYFAQRSTPRRLTRIPVLVLDAAKIVWRTSRPQTAGLIAVQLLTAGFSALIVLLGGKAVRQLLQVEQNVGLGRLLIPLVLLAVVSTVAGLASSGSSQFGRLLGARVQRAVSEKLLDVTTEVDLVTYDDADFHDQLNRVLLNVPTRPYEVVTCLASLIGGVAGVGALVITLLVIQPVLVPILVLGGVPLWFLARKGSRLEFNFAVAQTTSMREREYLEHTLSRREDAAELRAYRTAPPLRRRWSDLYDGYLSALKVQVRKRYTLAVVAGLASGLVLVATLLALIGLVHSGRVGLAQAAAAAVAIRLLSGRMQQLISGLSTLFESALFLEDWDQFLQRRPHDAGAAPSAEHAHTFRGLKAEHVSFRYPHATVDAVADVDIELKPGEILALVGENGSGKTTLAKVLAGLYEPAAGQVHLNGKAVGRVDLGDLRDSVALVLQDFMHYAFSATENIAFGRPEADLDEQRVAEAAERVGADRFLAELPDGYDTRLSKAFSGGRELSLGQWQRVALARAFYRDAPIIILDEPTAALDPRAEAQLFDSVRSLLAGRTVLLITHRLASVRGADRIVVLDQGRAVEQGDHDSLMAADGLYAELVNLQQARHIGLRADDALASDLAQEQA